MAGDWWLNILWIFAAAGLGLVIAGYFAGTLRIRRPLFLLPYVITSWALFAGYIIWSETDLVDFLMDNLLWGIVVAVIVGIILVFSVMKQPASQRTRGLKLVVDLFWSGLVYGATDGILLGALPILATVNAFDQLDWGSDVGSKIIVGLAAIAASAFVTAAYHAGYPEFRNRKIILPIIALAISSVGYFVAWNPMPILGSHAAMHIAAVVRGPEGTVQLPPHYNRPTRNE